MTLDVLICSYNKGIVRVGDIFHSPREDVHYIISYQYSEEKYLELIPKDIFKRNDVSFFKHKGRGLSLNRNIALSHATADLIMYADDDTLILDNTFDLVFNTFSQFPELDIVCFQASTYTGKLLKNYPIHASTLHKIPENYSISTIEMIFRRTKIQNIVSFNECFGLGTEIFTCGEEELWLYDALEKGLKIEYIPVQIIQTNLMLKRSLLYVDNGVQRSYGAINYYIHGKKAWWYCLKFALYSAYKGYCHFIPFMKHISQGIRFMEKARK